MPPINNVASEKSMIQKNASYKQRKAHFQKQPYQTFTQKKVRFISQINEIFVFIEFL